MKGSRLGRRGASLVSMGEAQEAEALRSQELLGKVGLGANSSLVWALQGRRIFSKIQCDRADSGPQRSQMPGAQSIER